MADGNRSRHQALRKEHERAAKDSPEHGDALAGLAARFAWVDTQLQDERRAVPSHLPGFLGPPSLYCFESLPAGREATITVQAVISSWGCGHDDARSGAAVARL
eukprot:SAG22_NODE_1123_length_5488_cov_53.464465_5_plen_104_part_00